MQFSPETEAIALIFLQKMLTIFKIFLFNFKNHAIFDKNKDWKKDNFKNHAIFAKNQGYRLTIFAKNAHFARSINSSKIREGIP